MECCGFIGLDVHKDTIAVAHAPGDGGALESLAVIGYNRNSLRRLMDLLSREGELLKFCYEAGPCGYGVVPGDHGSAGRTGAGPVASLEGPHVGVGSEPAG